MSPLPNPQPASSCMIGTACDANAGYRMGRKGWDGMGWEGRGGKGWDGDLAVSREAATDSPCTLLAGQGGERNPSLGLFLAFFVQHFSHITLT